MFRKASQIGSPSMKSFPTCLYPAFQEWVADCCISMASLLWEKNCLFISQRSHILSPSFIQQWIDNSCDWFSRSQSNQQRSIHSRPQQLHKCEPWNDHFLLSKRKQSRIDHDILSKKINKRAGTRTESTASSYRGCFQRASSTGL